MEELRCYRVKCIEENGTEHSVGIMTSSAERAKMKVVEGLKEGSHINTTAVSVEEVDAI